MVDVIGVHGIGNYRHFGETGSAETAARSAGAKWSAWLADGLRAAGHAAAGHAPAEVRIAYYAHHLHRGTPQGDDFATLDEDAMDLLVGWVAELHHAPGVAQGPRTARARAAMDWLTRKHGVAARRFAAAFAREVSTYLKEPSGRRRRAAREAVASAVAATVSAASGPVTVVAHSLGSVVAYEALWAHPELDVDRLITLGSPLGMPTVIFDRLEPAPGPRGGRPPGVRSWVNLADAGDLVAVPRDGLSGSFDGVDHEDTAITIGSWDFHTVRNYLASRHVADHLTG